MPEASRPEGKDCYWLSSFVYCKMFSSSIETSPTTSEYSSSDSSSVDSWRWDSTLDSCWRESEYHTTTTDDDSNVLPFSESRIQDFVWKKNEFTVVKEKKYPLIGIKKVCFYKIISLFFKYNRIFQIVKKCVSIISNPLNILRWREVYQFEPRSSINFFKYVYFLFWIFPEVAFYVLKNSYFFSTFFDSLFLVLFNSLHTPPLKTNFILWNSCSTTFVSLFKKFRN